MRVLVLESRPAYMALPYMAVTLAQQHAGSAAVASLPTQSTLCRTHPSAAAVKLGFGPGGEATGGGGGPRTGEGGGSRNGATPHMSHAIKHPAQSQEPTCHV